MMSLAITLPIYHHTKETTRKEYMDIDCDFSEYDIRYWQFFHIDAIGDYIDNGEEYGKIIASGTYFLSPLTKKELVRQIEEHLNKALPINLS